MLGDIILDILDMCETMQIANGYNYDYFVTYSPDVDCGETSYQCYIGISVGEEAEVEEGKSFSQYRAEIPITFVCRTPLAYDKIDDVETLEAIARSKAKDDLKKRFACAAKEIDDCVIFEPFAEEDIQQDTNAFTCFLRYTFLMTYKQPRTCPSV